MKRGRALSKSKLQSSGKNLCDDVPLSCYGSNGWAGCSRCKSTGPCCCSPRAQLVRHLSSSISSESCVFSPCNHQGRRNPARRHTDSSGYLEGVRPLADLRSSIARLSDVQVDTPDSACDDYDGYLPRRRCKRGLSCPWLLGFHHRRSDGDQDVIQCETPKRDSQLQDLSNQYHWQQQSPSPGNCLEVSPDSPMYLDNVHNNPHLKWAGIPVEQFQVEVTEDDTDSNPDVSWLSRAPALRRAKSDPANESPAVSPYAISRMKSESLSVLEGLLAPSHFDNEQESGSVLASMQSCDSQMSEEMESARSFTAQVGQGITPLRFRAKRNVTNSDFSTPVLRNCDSPRSEAMAGMQFPCFPPLEHRKAVYIIRHGESEYNAADKVASDWGDPKIFDPRLTQRGRAQAEELRTTLSDMPGLEDAVWIVSPLTRAIETFLLSFPFRDRLRSASRGEVIRGKLPEIVMFPDLREHAMTAGDVGRPASLLAQEFPELAGPLSALPEIWWNTSETRPNCALTGQFKSTESKAALAERVEVTRKWIIAREGKSFVAIGHSMFWKEFLGSNNRSTLKNCEVHKTCI